MEQIASTFDKKTIWKIVKGAFFAGLGAGSIAALQYLGAIHIDNATLATFVSFMVPFLTNLIKEYYSGKPKTA